MIKPDAYTNMGKIISIIEKNNFAIGNLRICRLSRADAEEFYAEHKVRKRNNRQ